VIKNIVSSLIVIIILTTHMPSKASEQTKAAVFKCLNEWIGDPDMDGSIEAWKGRLIMESKEHFRTSACLRKEVVKDRAAAVEFAGELDSWGLFKDEEARKGAV